MRRHTLLKISPLPSPKRLPSARLLEAGLRAGRSPLFALRARGPMGRRLKRGNSVRRQSPNSGLGVSNAALDGGASLLSPTRSGLRPGVVSDPEWSPTRRAKGGKEGFIFSVYTIID
ncbi:MAG: hypothetical protein A2V86_14345 [Deltaproteobacteria bacterium RBG_16_49_23]|nr:MAG: hypothetical protein A2V86_14345 [Deltaproteobacteria bacterium RBG_16_49_23]